MRKLKHKKGLSILLVLVLSLTALVACDSNDDTETADENQTEFEVLGSLSPLSVGYDSNEVLNEMQEEVGISIVWDTMSSGVDEQVGVRIAGQNLPDAFMGIGFSNYDLNRYGKDGTFIDLTEYINEDTMPNLTAILKGHPDIKKAITMADGNIYGLPAGEQMGTASIGAEEDYNIYTIPQFSMINKAWLDELGLDVPETTEELEEALVAFKENDMSATYYGNEEGSTIPLSVGYDEWCWGQNIFYAPFGFTNWTNDIINDLVLTPEGEVKFASATDNYRQAVEWFHSLYEQGLVDIEMFSQSSSQYIAKSSSGQVGVAVWWYIEEVMGDFSEDYVFLPPLKNESGDLNITVRDGGAINSGNLSITSACGNPEALLAFYDLWYKPESVMQLQYGPIDVFWTSQDEDGKWVPITEEESIEKYDMSAGELKATHEVAGPKLILSEYYNENFYMEPRAEERLDDLYNYWMEYVDDATTYPIDMVYSNDELEIIDLYKVDFENKVAEYEANWIKDGAPSDEEWDAYLDGLDEAGMSQLIEVYQAAYDRYKAE